VRLSAQPKALTPRLNTGIALLGTKVTTRAVPTMINAEKLPTLTGVGSPDFGDVVDDA